MVCRLTADADDHSTVDFECNERPPIRRARRKVYSAVDTVKDPPSAVRSGLPAFFAEHGVARPLAAKLRA
jgi:hypothetical protein